ncbi:MAG: FUSC family protein, partial [Angustibacter sp.]
AGRPAGRVLTRRPPPDSLRVLRRRARPIVMRTSRLTVAAVLSYLVARAVFDTPQPLTGPLTALLVVQATLFSTLTTGVRRVLSVVAGVLVAVVLSNVVGLTWWSLGGAIAAAIVIGQLLRLGDHLLEVPISAMLVLSVTSAETAGYARIAETLVGAGVGVLVNLVLPPNLRTRNAAASVERVAERAAVLLDRVAEELPHGVPAEQARGGRGDFRGLNRYVEDADRALQAAGDSRRLNPRAVGTVDTMPVLRSGLDALEHSTVSLRALFRSLADGLPEQRPDDAAQGEHPDTPPDQPAPETSGYDEPLRAAFAVLLSDLADAVRAFGRLVSAEADAIESDPTIATLRLDDSTDGSASPDRAAEAPLRTALDALRETRARVTDLLLVDAASDPALWQLRGSLLAAVERVLVELDVEERARRRRQQLREAEQRRSHRAAAVRARAAAGRRRAAERRLTAGTRSPHRADRLPPRGSTGGPM